MKQTVYENDFIDAFNDIRPDNFSYAGLQAMFEWFEDMDEQCDTETELDVIAICCEFTEYDSLADILSEYDLEDLDDLTDHTMVIEIPEFKSDFVPSLNRNTGYIIQDF